MTVTEHEIDVVALPAREHELAADTETFELLVGRFDFFQRRLQYALGAPVDIFEAFELRYRFDQPGLALDRLDQSQAMLIDGHPVKADQRYTAYQQCGCGHDQK